MGKRIVLFADGTGNRGGSSPDTNVYKVYQALERHDPNNKQIAFYDIGVGTSQNPYWRGLSGAVGFGFMKNVRDLYRFLARNYDPGDEVFLFGFSRGAATMRAFTGLVASSGLVDGREVTRDELDKRVKAACKRYQSSRGRPFAVDTASGQGSHGAIPIKFIGVWDTVSALGFPNHWQLPGIGMWVFNTVSWVLDRAVEPFFPHRFYNYELTGNIENAYQALAVDDERASFWPMIWDETKSPSTNVEQVWFPGAHSNVGGGYGRTGLAAISLDWMSRRAQRHGLALVSGGNQETSDRADVAGRLYDSRSGGAMFFRYTPRDIQSLSTVAKQSPIQVHRSVIGRMHRKTAEYAPGQLPYAFDLVDTPLDAPPKAVITAETPEEWERIGKKVKRFVMVRMVLRPIPRGNTGHGRCRNLLLADGSQPGRESEDDGEPDPLARVAARASRGVSQVVDAQDVRATDRCRLPGKAPHPPDLGPVLRDAMVPSR